ncbi:protein translocase subunit SecF [Natranaerobius trueperi]|uniref:Protein-export membrane protein SecF n=2 Tax=Natranaerobius trueperi TaxID=759412 RepID=A0A226BXV2_9FIRM|nr:protein translocase subunit SecF [Natranaerobius trueperi]
MACKGVSHMEIITKRKMWFLVSLVIVIIGFGSLILNGLNLGIDFTGGTILHVSLGEEYEVEEVRDVLEDFGLEDSVIQQATDSQGETSEVIIRTTSLQEQERNEIIEGLRGNWPQIEDEDVLRSANVGATIGDELRSQAIWSLLIASIGMIAYISYRFEFSFAISAIVAILHDAFIVLTIFSLFQIEINSPFIAAVLTIIGYSINDTIVIFDRIRETLQLEKKLPLNDVITTSISKTLTRSLNTSGTTTLVLLSLLIFGGVTLRPFILALLIGVISGTYSSVFIASNVWSTLSEKMGSQYGNRKKSTS